MVIEPADVIEMTSEQPDAVSSSATSTAYGAPTAQGTMPSDAVDVGHPELGVVARPVVVSPRPTLPAQVPDNVTVGVE